MRALAVLTLRNEGAFLIEWLAHHRAIGFTDFLVLSNDCEDGTDAMLDRLDAMGEITHLPNPGPHEGGIQFAGLKRADAHPMVKEAEWIATLDIDEFVNIHVGDHSLSALAKALPEADAIALTWRFFGNGGVVMYEDRPVTEVFTRAAPAVLHWPWRAAMFKTLYRNTGAYKKLGVHRPRSPVERLADGARWFDGAGREMDPAYRRGKIFTPFGRDNYALAQLNHYALGAMASYLLKVARGRAVHEGERLGMDYWVERNWSTDEDRTIAASAPGRAAEMARLMGDEALATLHHAAVAWRQARFEALMGEEPYRALFGRLLMTPPARPLPPKLAHPLLRYAQKAQIPPRDGA